MNKVLTVVVPAYNMEKYLDKCLTSLILQDADLMNQLEVLVVNDGSKDRSSEIAHGYQNRFPETFRVIDKENGNYGSCINRGLKEAKGKYIKILDADDSFDNKSFASYIEFLELADCDMILNDFKHVDDSGRTIRKIRHKQPINKVFSMNGISPRKMRTILMHGVAYKTDILRKMNYHQTEGISYTDMEWVFMPCSKVHTISYFNKYLYCYLWGREGQTVDSVIHAKSISHENRVLETMITFYESLNDKGEANYYLDNRLRRRLANLYKLYLLNDALSVDGLSDFDFFLKKKSPRYYDISHSFSLTWWFPFKYIKWWRLNQNRQSLPKWCMRVYWVNSKLNSIWKRVFCEI